MKATGNETRKTINIDWLDSLYKDALVLASAAVTVGLMGQLGSRLVLSYPSHAQVVETDYLAEAWQTSQFSDLGLLALFGGSLTMVVALFISLQITDKPGHRTSSLETGREVAHGLLFWSCAFAEMLAGLLIPTTTHTFGWFAGLLATLVPAYGCSVLQGFSRTLDSTRRNRKAAEMLQSRAHRLIDIAHQERSASPQRGAALLWGLIMAIFPSLAIILFLGFRNQVSLDTIAAPIWLLFVGPPSAALVHITLLQSQLWQQNWKWAAAAGITVVIWFSLYYLPVADLSGSWQIGMATLAVPILLVGSWMALKRPLLGYRRLTFLEQELEHAKRWLSNLAKLEHQIRARQGLSAIIRQSLLRPGRLTRYAPTRTGRSRRQH